VQVLLPTAQHNVACATAHPKWFGIEQIKRKSMASLNSNLQKFLHERMSWIGFFNLFADAEFQSEASKFPMQP